jgi:hypothetical protein
MTQLALALRVTHLMPMSDEEILIPRAGWGRIESPGIPKGSEA